MIIMMYFAIGNFRGIFSSVNMLKGYILICWNAEGHMLISRNAEGVHGHLSECWRGTWSEKGWESPH